MKVFLTLMVLAAGVWVGTAARAQTPVNGPTASITLAQDEHDHADPAAGVDESPLTNLAFPAIMVAGALVYLALTRRRVHKR
jgi:hypothetical protein